MLKAQVSLAGASLAAVFKSWWQPSFTLAGAAGYDFASGRSRFGVTAAVETFKNIRWVLGVLVGGVMDWAGLVDWVGGDWRAGKHRERALGGAGQSRGEAGWAS